MWRIESDGRPGGSGRGVIVVLIVGFDVGGDWMGIERCGWFGRWVNGGHRGRSMRWGSGGLCSWYGCRHIWCWCVLGLVA